MGIGVCGGHLCTLCGTQYRDLRFNRKSGGNVTFIRKNKTDNKKTIAFSILKTNLSKHAARCYSLYKHFTNNNNTIDHVWWVQAHCGRNLQYIQDLTLSTRHLDMYSSSQGLADLVPTVS